MKKKLLASLLAIAMMVSMVTPAMAAEAAPADTGYDVKALPTAPIVNGDTITVTPENAQYTLDGAYGPINGKTIHFSAGDYKDVLVLNRPTKYAGSETQYFNNNKEKKDNPSDLNTSGTCYYARTVQNVTFTAEKGATLNGFLASSGHVYGEKDKPVYDYVREKEIFDTNNSYYGYCSLKNVSFEGLTLNGIVRVADYMDTKNMANSESIASINDGIHFTNCTFKGDSKKMADSGFAAVKFNADTEYFSNVTVDHCTITNYYQGVYVQGVDGLAVCNNVIDNTTHNAIAVQNGGKEEGPKNPVKGDVLIKENVIKNAKDRAIRFGEANTAERITINNNFMINSGDEKGELIKATSIPADASVMNLDNNYWNGKDAAEVVQTFTPPTKVGVISGNFGCDVRDYLASTLTQDKNGNVVSYNESDAVAQVDNKNYNSLQAAIAAVPDNGTILLLKDDERTNQLNVNKNCTLDLNDKTLKNTAGNSIVVSANKTLNLKNGTVKNTSGRIGVAGLKNATLNIAPDVIIDTVGHAVFGTNNSGEEGHATININGATIKSSNGVGVLIQGPKNTVNIDGATIQSNYFGVYQNGSFGGGTFNIKNTTIVDKMWTGVYIANSKGNAENKDQGYQTLNIENCNITGKTAVETKYTYVTVKGDTTLTATGNPVSVIPNNNGAATEGYALAITHNAKDPDKDSAAGTITIENGNFNGYVGIQEPSEGHTTAATMTINGGYFTNDISDYVASGKAAVGSDKSDYTWMVKDAVPTDVEPAVGEPTVDVSAIPEADQATVQDVVESVEAGGLAAYASTEAEKVTDAQQAAATKALKDAVQGVTDDNIHIYSQAYLAIEATSYDATNKTLTLDITPMVRVVASTADNAENITLEGKNKNAVVLADSDKNLSVSGRVEMHITLPDGFADSKAYVQHKGYEYEATVQNNVATFINPHGFSTFTFSKNPQAVASIGSQSYTDLEAALKDAKDGQTITLLKDGLSATMSGDNRTVHFVGANDTVKTVTVNGQTVNVPGDYTYTASTGGGVVIRYDVTLADTDNGSITATHKRASKNSTVTITATPDEGYVVDAVTVTEKDGDKVNVTKKDDNKYTFKMPASDVTVKVTFKVAQIEPPGLPFTDVAKDAWYFPAVEYVFNNGLMNGTTATTFAPNVNLNRAMMAAVLYNMEGQPACDKSGLFSDVADGKWYTDAVNWAASNNIVSGMPDGTYAPDQALTREQMASILYRYAEYKGIDVSARADLSTFTDGTTVSPWAQDVVQWAVAEKLMSGNGNELQPKGTATRAQVATVLMNYCENVAK